jgi:hypothetical protein
MPKAPYKRGVAGSKPADRAQWTGGVSEVQLTFREKSYLEIRPGTRELVQALNELDVGRPNAPRDLRPSWSVQGKIVLVLRQTLDGVCQAEG